MLSEHALVFAYTHFSSNFYFETGLMYARLTLNC